jgi:hypothetical protein
MTTAQLNQSAYITVGRDMRGSGCWLVVTADQVIECVSGERALALLEAAIKSKQ